jgi:hypothetical protein
VIIFFSFVLNQLSLIRGMLQLFASTLPFYFVKWNSDSTRIFFGFVLDRFSSS